MEQPLSTLSKPLPIIDVLHFLWGWRKFYIFVFICAAIGSSIFALSLKKQYTATAIIAPSNTNSMPKLPSFINDLPFGLSSDILGIDMTQNSGLDRYLSILGSRQLKLQIINRFSLTQVYKFEKKRQPTKKSKFFIEDVLQALDENHIVSELDDGTILVGFIDKSPKRAYDIVSFMISQLDSTNRAMTQRTLSEKIAFLQTRLEDNSLALRLAEDSLVSYQSASGIIVPEQQARSSALALADLETKLMALNTELSLLSSKYGKESYEVKEKVRDSETLRAQLQSLDTHSIGSVLIPFKKIPGELINFDRLTRNIKVYGTVQAMLTQEYEKARIDIKNTMATVTVIDKPIVPQKRTKPNRRKIVFFSSIFAAFMAIALSYVIEFAADQSSITIAQQIRSRFK
jgi:uncharacterized protein involved in exopolysaccharide biosynthesis